MSYYYEILKSSLEALEIVYGLPDSMVTREWRDVTTSVDGLWVIIESNEPLDEEILGVSAITREEAVVLRNSPKYMLGDIDS
jgi:hypothetical protein